MKPEIKKLLKKMALVDGIILGVILPHQTTTPH